MKVYVLQMFDTEDEDLVHTSVHASLTGAQSSADEQLTDEDECWSDPTPERDDVPGWHSHAASGTWNAVCSYMDATISELEVLP